jgi:hypothetical protein
MARVAGFFRELERQRLGALVKVDLDLLERMHSPDYQLITPGGATLTRDDYLGGVESGQLDYRVFEPASDIAVRVHESVALLRYLARIDIRFSDEGDGGIFWHTDAYELNGDQWQVVWSQATRARGA